MGLINLYRKKQLYDLIQQARQDRRVLQTPQWWTRLLLTAWAVKEIRQMLAGYKTYLVAAVAGAVVVAQALGYIDEATAQTLLTALGFGGLATLRASVGKVEKAAAQDK